MLSLRGLLPLLVNRPEFRRLLDRLTNQSESPVLSGVVEAAKPYIVAALAVSLDRPVLYVVRDAGEAERVTETLIGLIGRDFPVLPYADRDALPYERLMPDALSVQSRMNVLTALTRPAGAMVVVCSVRALSQPVMPPEEFTQAIVELRNGLAIDPRILLQHLLSLGYEQVAEIESSGQMSHRGGIIDIFPPALVRPVRIEFFGEEIDSIRTFDQTTQRSLNPVDAVLVGPAREALALQGPVAARQLE
jgi:transcription-repair coupling factor (superfamily II helicase)